MDVTAFFADDAKGDVPGGAEGYGNAGDIRVHPDLPF